MVKRFWIVWRGHGEGIKRSPRHVATGNPRHINENAYTHHGKYKYRLKG